MDATKHELSIGDATSFCRLCLKTESIEIIVSSPEEGHEPLLNVVSECLGIWLTVNEDFPFGICHACSMSLEAIRQFRYNCQQCDLYLRTQRATAETSRVVVMSNELHTPVEQQPVVGNGQHLEAHSNAMSVHDVKLEESVIPVSEFNENDNEMNSIAAQYYETVAPEVPAEPAVPTNRFNCPECGKQLYSSRMLAQHVVREHRLCHGCGSCGMSYNSQQKLDSHKATCLGRPSRFMCDQCPSAKVFSTAASLSIHLYYAHDSLKSVVYRCEACKKNFKNRTGLKYHYKMGHGCTMVECEICRRPFPTEESLYYHKQAEH